MPIPPPNFGRTSRSPHTIRSGGQTGVDRAALDAALAAGLARGGWCPRGRLAEDGAIPSRYPLQETPEPDYAQRTTWNVRDSEGTLVIAPGIPRGGSALTIRVAGSLGKPCLVVDPNRPDAAEEIGFWLELHRIGELNVAGPREGESPGVYEQARRLLERVLGKADG